MQTGRKVRPMNGMEWNGRIQRHSISSDTLVAASTEIEIEIEIEIVIVNYG